MTEQEAYRAMYYFLEKYYSYIKSEEIANLLGGLSLLPDGSTADPAFETEWSDSIKRAKVDTEGVKLKFVE